MSEVELVKTIVYQSLGDLYSKSRKKRTQAIEWLHGTGEIKAIVTCQECCDVTGMNIEQVKRIAEGIISGKLSVAKFREIMKGH